MARTAAARAAAPVPRRAPARRAPAPRPTPRPVPSRGRARAPRSRRQVLAARLGAIPHSPFVDRLLTGRAWIVLLAVLLAGIVFANVTLLEMNAGIARTTEEVAALKRENSRLRLKAARLGSSERIQSAAADLGLVLPAPGQVRYLKARPEKDASLALRRMSAPDPVPVATAPIAPEPVPVAEPAPAPAPEPVATDPAATAPTPVADTTDPAAAPPPATTGQTD